MPRAWIEYASGSSARIETPQVTVEAGTVPVNRHPQARSKPATSPPATFTSPTADGLFGYTQRRMRVAS